jgi:membrane protease YdiL (CAAX protease family)
VSDDQQGDAEPPVWPALIVIGVVISVKAGHLWYDEEISDLATIVRQGILVVAALAFAAYFLRGRTSEVVGFVPARRVERKRKGAEIVSETVSRKPAWLWLAVPPVLVVAVWAVVALKRGHVNDLHLVTQARIIFATGVGEEVLFRGVAFGLALRRSLFAALVISSIGFGFWHLPDAVVTVSKEDWAWEADALYLAGTAVSMTLVGLLVFGPLRLLSRVVWGPVLMHTAWNLGLRLVV